MTPEMYERATPIMDRIAQLERIKKVLMEGKPHDISVEYFESQEAEDDDDLSNILLSQGTPSIIPQFVYGMLETTNRLIEKEKLALSGISPSEFSPVPEISS